MLDRQHTIANDETTHLNRYNLSKHFFCDRNLSSRNRWQSPDQVLELATPSKCSSRGEYYDFPVQFLADSVKVEKSYLNISTRSFSSPKTNFHRRKWSSIVVWNKSVLLELRSSSAQLLPMLAPLEQCVKIQI